MISAAALIDNGCRSQYFVVLFQEMAVQNGRWSNVCESMYTMVQLFLFQNRN